MPLIIGTAECLLGTGQVLLSPISACSHAYGTAHEHCTLNCIHFGARLTNPNLSLSGCASGKALCNQPDVQNHMKSQNWLRRAGGWLAEGVYGRWYILCQHALEH